VWRCQKDCDKPLYCHTTDRGAPCVFYPAIKRSVVCALSFVRCSSTNCDEAKTGKSITKADSAPVWRDRYAKSSVTAHLVGGHRSLLQGVLSCHYMEAVGMFSSFSFRKKLFLAGAVLVLLGSLLTFGCSEMRAGQEIGFSQDRWNRSFSLAASPKNAVILVKPNGTEHGQELMLVDFHSGKRTKIKSEGANLLSPYLSPDGTRLLFSRRPLDRLGDELVSCNTSDLTCHVVLRSAGSIYSAIEVSRDRILYVSSPYWRAGDRVRLNHDDIWIFEPATGPRQLTDFKLYQLHSLSVTQSHIYFSAYGASRDRPVVPQPEPLADQQSSIFRLPFDPEKAAIEPPSGTMTPLFLSAGMANDPTASADGSLVAFLRTRTGISPYHYNLVIADQNSHSERLIESTGLGSSRPVIIDHDVYASVTEKDRILIQVYRQGTHSMEQIADIDDTSMVGVETVELEIKP
jgi:hypothetical protein